MENSHTTAWAGLRAIGLVERERRVGAAVSVETRHYLLSGAGGAAAFGHAVRSHWGIENRVHWVLDVVFREDESRVRSGDGAANLAVLRHFALNLLRQERTAKGSLATKRFRAALDDTYLLTVLADPTSPIPRSTTRRISPRSYIAHEPPRVGYRNRCGLAVQRATKGAGPSKPRLCAWLNC